MLMQYPEILTPTAIEKIRLPSGQRVSIQKTCPIFELWTGAPLEDTYGNKTILNFEGEPVFAELAILRILQRHGWNGVWVDTFTHAYRVAFRTQQHGVQLPTDEQVLLDQIYRQAGSTKGCWDVFCWQNECNLFAESKRQGRDRLRETQRRWLSAALACELPPSTFLVVEWSVKDIGPTATL